MDINKEREAFEIAFDKKLGARGCQFDLDEDGNYEDRETLCGWHMWLEAKAQAVPEGFILVSAEQMSQWATWLIALKSMDALSVMKPEGMRIVWLVKLMLISM